jgi:DNA-binding MarR family transcriptional regulator
VNAYSTQQVRSRYRVTWQEEYIIGLVNKETPIGTMGVLKIAENEAVMSPATTHKYLTNVVAKKFVSEQMVKTDKRSLALKLTEKGEKFLEEIKHGYVRK